MDFNVDFEKMAELGLLLRKLREKSGLTLDVVSKKTKINISELSRIETGQTLKINPLKLLELANIYKINVLNLYEIVGYINKNDTRTFEKNNVIIEKINEEIEFQKSKYIPIPVYKSVSAGYGAFPSDEPVTFITVPITNSKDLRAAYVKGDSMSPTLNDGSIVIFDPFVERLKNKEIGIFKVNDEVYLKRFYSQDGQVILTSDNIFYEPIFVRKSDNFMICGKYIASLSF